MQSRRCFLVAAVVCLLAACTTEPERARAIGEAYVGPSTMPLRKELSQRSEVVAELKHGAKLEILGVRRRFVRVRNMGGDEGWLDSRNLLSASQVHRYTKLLETAGQLPSQGRATVSDILNIHTEPNRQAPSPFQIPANGSVHVLAHSVTDRVPYPSILPAILEKPKKAARKPRKRTTTTSKQDAPKEGPSPDQKDQVPPPPMPKAPTPPPQWEDLSRTALPGAPPRLRDDWTLIRTSENHAGWVLTRQLSLSIPDEVAQYANGKRITAYFPLGEVQDEDQKKHHWLMATVNGPYQSHDFDAWRVFVYNAKKHRYESGGADREFRGYYPILRQSTEITEGRRTLQAESFTVITEDPAGTRWKKTYAFHSGRVRVVKREPLQPTPSTEQGNPFVPTAAPSNGSGSESASGLFTRIKNWFE